MLRMYHLLKIQKIIFVCKYYGTSSNCLSGLFALFVVCFLKTFVQENSACIHLGH